MHPDLSQPQRYSLHIFQSFIVHWQRKQSSLGFSPKSRFQCANKCVQSGITVEWNPKIPIRSKKVALVEIQVQQKGGLVTAVDVSRAGVNGVNIGSCNAHLQRIKLILRKWLCTTASFHCFSYIFQHVDLEILVVCSNFLFSVDPAFNADSGLLKARDFCENEELI